MYLGAPLMHRGMHPLSRQRQQPVAQSCGLLLIGEPDTVERKVLEIGIGPQVHVDPPYLSKQLAGSYEVPRLPFSGPHRRKPRRSGAGAGLQRAVRLGGLVLDTEPSVETNMIRGRGKSFVPSYRGS